MLNLAMQMYTALTNSVSKLSENIGYSFQSKDLLVQAFVDSSFPLMGAMLAEGQGLTMDESNESFIWRGNYILQLVIADYIEANHHGADKSTKNVLFNKYISADSCDDYINKLQVFNSYLYQCPHGMHQQSAEKLIAPFKVKCFKALLAAIYLDAGKSLDPIQKLFEDKLIVEDPLADSRDIASSTEVLNENYKSLLNELCQQKRLGQLLFTVAGRSGPDHAPTFKVQLTLDGEAIAEGESTSKKQAEQIAAKSAYDKLISAKK